jgi:hypothetical protein
VRRPDDYAAKLYKGLALREAAHAAQAGFRALYSAATKEEFSEDKREAYVAPIRSRLRSDIARSRESLEAAARLRPSNGRALFELVELYWGLGYRKDAQPFFERLRAVGDEWWERAQERFKSDK